MYINNFTTNKGMLTQVWYYDNFMQTMIKLNLFWFKFFFAFANDIELYVLLGICYYLVQKENTEKNKVWWLKFWLIHKIQRSILVQFLGVLFFYFS